MTNVFATLKRKFLTLYVVFILVKVKSISQGIFTFFSSFCYTIKKIFLQALWKLIVSPMNNCFHFKIKSFLYINNFFKKACQKLIKVLVRRRICSGQCFIYSRFRYAIKYYSLSVLTRFCNKDYPADQPYSK